MIAQNSKRSYYSYLIFFFLIYVAFYGVYDFEQQYWDITILRFTLFQFGFVLTIPLIIFSLRYFLSQRDQNLSYDFIKIIYLYVIYQITVVTPLTALETNMKPISYFKPLIHRAYFLLIPAFLFLLVKQKIDVFKLRNFLNFASILMIAVSFYNMSEGLFLTTSTGEPRYLAGTTALFFGFSLVTSFSFFSNEKNKYLFFLVAIIGLIFVNHRSAYLAVLVLFLVGVMNLKGLKDRGKKLFLISTVLLISIIIISQSPVLQSQFWGRAKTSFDYQDGTANDRLIRWVLSWNNFLENPINGSLLENKYYTDDALVEATYAPHNFIFETLSTQGLAGFIFIFLIIYKLMKIAYKNRQDPLSYQMYLFLIFYIFYSLFNVTFTHDWNFVLFVVAASIVLYRNIILVSDSKNILQK